MPHPQPSYRQPDLFAPQKPPTPIPAADRMKLLALVSALLTETAAVAGVEADDEDHG
jgi:hypothetical protein